MYYMFKSKLKLIYGIKCQNIYYFGKDTEVSKGHKQGFCGGAGQILLSFLVRAVAIWMCPISDN